MLRAQELAKRLEAARQEGYEFVTVTPESGKS